MEKARERPLGRSHVCLYGMYRTADVHRLPHSDTDVSV